VFFICHRFFRDLPPEAATHSLNTIAAYVLSLLLCFLLGYFMEASMGLLGFWFMEIGSLLFVYMLFTFFLSGHMFPLDMLSEPWRTMVELSPLQYLAYFPAAVFLGKVTGPELVRGLWIEACCSSWFFRACCFTWA